MAEKPRHAAPKGNEPSEKTVVRLGCFLIIVIVTAIVLITVKIAGGDEPKPTEPQATIEMTTEAPETTTTEAPTTTTTAAPTTTTTTSTTAKNTGVTVNSDGSIVFYPSSAYKAKYCVGVNRQMNVVTVYGKDDNGKYTVPKKAFACSCGRSGHETPTGTFSTSDKCPWLHMVDNSEGQYTIRIKGPIWFHSVCYFTKDKSDLEYEEYNKLGGPASLGCVRLCCGDAKWLYDNLDYGTIVTIYDSNLPGPLGKPKTIKIDVNDSRRGWDPTDPDPENPWNA
ncbi:MAG: L,D-transpeptidase [Clostridia bacterium]|nr:L,D-transpeptidase [Clostridia bacterium]